MADELSSDENLQKLYDEDKLTHYNDLKKLGLVLFPYNFEKQLTINEVLEKFQDISEDPSTESISTAGRIMQKRGHGKVIFLDIR